MLQVFRRSVLGISVRVLCFFFLIINVFFLILVRWVYSSLICCSDLGEPLAEILFGALQILQTGMQVYAIVIH